MGEGMGEEVARMCGASRIGEPLCFDGVAIGGPQPPAAEARISRPLAASLRRLLPDRKCMRHTRQAERRVAHSMV